MSTGLLSTLLACALLAPIAAAGPGDLDPTFGNGGYAKTFKGHSGDCMAIQPDGKIVVAGQRSEHFVGHDDKGHTRTYWGVARFQQNGQPDPTFHGKGRLHTFFSFTVNDAAPSCVAIQADGKIVVAGIGSDNFVLSFVLARYTSDGYPDPTFGSANGQQVTYIPDGMTGATCIAIQSDGKILVAGATSQYTTDFQGYFFTINTRFVLLRYNANGKLDTSFGHNGKVFTSVGPQNYIGTYIARPKAIAIQLNGKIVLVGDADSLNGSKRASPDVVILRYNTDGTLDPTFGGTGIVTTNMNAGSSDVAEGIALNRFGIYVAGTTISAAGQYNAFLIRYTHTGLLDAGFSGNGKLTSDFDGRANSAAGVALQRDGKILLAGTAHNGLNYDFTLSRYTLDGVLDTLFGNNGKVTTNFFGAYNQADYASAVAVAPDGKIVIAGTVVFGVSQMGVVRYQGDPIP